MIHTRHEQIAIVLASYVIGFTTAFIAFGVSDMHSKEAPITNTSYIKKVSYKEAHNNISEIGTDSDGLYVKVGGYPRTISSYRSTLPASAIESTSLAGYALAHHTPVVSNDGWFAFYCEQQSEEDTCVPYVYSLFDDTVHPVTLNDVSQPLDVGIYSASWDTAGYLFINSFSSASAEAPWKFYSPVEDVEEIDVVSEDDATADALEVSAEQEIAEQDETTTLNPQVQ